MTFNLINTFQFESQTNIYSSSVLAQDGTLLLNKSGSFFFSQIEKKVDFRRANN